MDILHRANVTLSLDDFGAGYSSLRHLDEMNLSEVKIDGDLVQNIIHKNKRIVVKSLVSMCQDLNIKVVAECIEDEEIRKILTDMKCDIGQGYGISKPQKLPDMLSWIESNKNNA